MVANEVRHVYISEFNLTNLNDNSEPSCDGVDQWGVVFGTCQDSSLGDERELYLRTLRQRRWGENNSSTLHRYCIISLESSF